MAGECVVCGFKDKGRGLLACPRCGCRLEFPDCGSCEGCAKRGSKECDEKRK